MKANLYADVYKAQVEMLTLRKLYGLDGSDVRVTRVPVQMLDQWTDLLQQVLREEGSEADGEE